MVRQEYLTGDNLPKCSFVPICTMTLYLNYNKFYILMILVRKTMFTKLKEDPRTEKGISNVNKGLNCTKDIISP